MTEVTCTSKGMTSFFDDLLMHEILSIFATYILHLSCTLVTMVHLPLRLSSFSDSMQSRSFATDIRNLKDLLERGKADLFLESKARSQLAAECQSLSVLLLERVRSMFGNQS